MSAVVSFLMTATTLVVGSECGSDFKAEFAQFAQAAKTQVDFVCADPLTWKKAVSARTDIDSVVVPLDDAKLLGEIRQALPQALCYVEQPWASPQAKCTLLDYDRLSLNCSRYTIANGLETIPTGFAVEAYRGEMKTEEFEADVLDASGRLTPRGNYLRAAVWFSKFSGVDIRRLGVDSLKLGTRYELSFLRRCAQEAVNIYTPVPVKNCALEAIWRMTPVPVEQEWWKKRLADKQKEIAASGGHFDLVFVGSSQIHIWETRCPVQMKDLKRDFTVLNLGYSGDSFQKVYWRLTKGKELDGYTCKCLMMVQGGNNTQETPTAIALGMKMLLDAFKVKQPQAKVILHPVNPRREWDPGCPATTPRPRPEADRANALLKILAEANDQVIWCDFRDEYYDENDDTLWCMPGDRLHAGTEGLKIWYSHISPIFHEVCGKPLPPVTPGVLPDATPRQYYKTRPFIWQALFKNRGGFALEKREGAEGKIEMKDGRLMIHKTNDEGYLLVKAHPFAAYTHVPMRLYADVEVADCSPERSFGFLRVFGRTEDLSIQPKHRAVEPVESWEAATGLEIRPAGATTRKYIHFNSLDGDNCPVIIIAGQPSKTYWTNWCAEETNDPGNRAWRKNPLPDSTRKLMPTAGESPSTTVVLGADPKEPMTAAQLKLLDVSGVPYELLTVEEAVKRTKDLAKRKTTVFLGVRRLDGEVAKLVEAVDKPGKLVMYIGNSGIEGGLPSCTGMKLSYSSIPLSHETKSTSNRWTDLTPGAYLRTLVESYEFGQNASGRLTVLKAPRATLSGPDKLTQIYAVFTDDKSPAIAARRNAKGCFHVFIGTAGGLSPDYFNRLVREQGGYAAIDESGVEVKIKGNKIFVRAERPGRFDLTKPNGEKMTLRLVAGMVVEL